MLLLTGASGNVGGVAACMIAGAGVPARFITRDAEKARQIGSDLLHPCVGDVGDREFLASAMDGVTKAFLVLPNGEQQLALEQGFVDAARAAGVKHVVKLSSIEAHAGVEARIPAAHAESEEYLKASGLDWTLVKPNFFMQTLLAAAAGVKANDALALPCGDGRVSMIDARDVGAVVAKVMTEEGHAGAAYSLTGPETVSFSDVAAALGATLGRTIHYKDMPIEIYRGILSNVIPSTWRVDAVCEIFCGIAEGQSELEPVLPTVESLLGRPATPLAQFIADYRGAFE